MRMYSRTTTKMNGPRCIHACVLYVCITLLRDSRKNMCVRACNDRMCTILGRTIQRYSSIYSSWCSVCAGSSASSFRLKTYFYSKYGRIFRRAVFESYPQCFRRVKRKRPSSATCSISSFPRINFKKIPVCCTCYALLIDRTSDIHTFSFVHGKRRSSKNEHCELKFCAICIRT